MAPVEWPIAALSDDPAATSTRRGDRDRLATVRADFFLDPKARLTEQERALMTAMLADLVAIVADEVRMAAEVRSQVANDHGADVFDRLTASGLLDIPELIALLLRRAEQERVLATVGRGDSGSRASFLHMLAASDDPAVSAAAMAFVLGRSRRRDRFGAPRVVLDDIPVDAAVPFVHAVTAVVRGEEAAGTDADRRLCGAAAAVIARHDEGKRMEALSVALVHALDRAGQLDDESLRSAFAHGDLGIFIEALSRRAGVDSDAAWGRLAGGGRDLACLLRMAAVPREIAAEIAAALGDRGGVGPAGLIGMFDCLSDDEVERTRGWLRLDRQYREALTMLGEPRGDAAD